MDRGHISIRKYSSSHGIEMQSSIALYTDLKMCDASFPLLEKSGTGHHDRNFPHWYILPYLFLLGFESASS
jgi:hypothetical protein